MSTFTFPSKPVAIPNSNNNRNNEEEEEQTYKDIIKQLTAQAPEPYGAIPPLKKNKKDKKRKVPIRRMFHLENWIALDSQESIPDEEDLRHSSPFRNFLSTDFLVLPLHMPPPSLSETVPPPPPPIIKQNNKVILSKSTPTTKSNFTSMIQVGEYDEEEEEEEEEGEEEEEEDNNKSITSERSIPSFSKSLTPSTSTTKSYAMSSSPPQSQSPNTIQESRSRWMETIAQLRKSLTRSNLTRNNLPLKSNKDFIPMPLLPPLPLSKRKRRSEATTQPRFNTETNTYTRDIRSNSDHLRMISAELNMMRARKLSSPLKPRGFLPRRTDSFISGNKRKLSLLRNQLILSEE